MKRTLMYAVAVLVGAGLTMPAQAYTWGSSTSCESGYCGLTTTAGAPAKQVTKRAPRGMSKAAFLSTAARENRAEIEYARLAVERGASPEVRQFAERIIEERQKLAASLDQLSEKEGVKLPEGLSKARERDVKRLEKLEGAEFDAEFLRLVADLRSRNLWSFSTKAQAFRDSDVRSWIREAMPIVKAEVPKPGSAEAVR